MEYKITFPENYIKIPLPGRDVWTAALRSGKYAQTVKVLCQELEPSSLVSQAEREEAGTCKLGYCCMGLLSQLQGALVFNGCSQEYADTWNVNDMARSVSVISGYNPLAEVFSVQGIFPPEVKVYVSSAAPAEGETFQGIALISLAVANDHGLTFLQIADIIDAIWDDGGPLPMRADHKEPSTEKDELPEGN